MPGLQATLKRRNYLAALPISQAIQVSLCVHRVVRDADHLQARVANVFRLGYRANADATDDSLAQRLAAADFHGDARCHLRRFQRIVQRQPRSRTLLTAQQRLPLQGLQRHLIVAGERVIGAGEQDHRVPGITLCDKRRIMVQPRQHTDIGHIALQIGQH